MKNLVVENEVPQQRQGLLLVAVDEVLGGVAGLEPCAPGGALAPRLQPQQRHVRVVHLREDKGGGYRRGSRVWAFKSHVSEEIFKPWNAQM